MREFLYKYSFFRYAAAVNSCGGRRVPIAATFISFYVLMVLSLTFGAASANAIGAVAAMVACMLYFAGSLTGAYRNVNPNLAKLMPLSGKRKCVYDFLLTLFYSLVAIIAVAVLIGIIALIVLTVVQATGGAESGGGDNPFLYPVGVYGGIFCAAYIVILYSAGMISGYIKNRRRRNIFLTAFLVAVAAGILLTGLPYILNGVYDPELLRFCPPFIDECYKYMKLPWLCSVAWGLTAAGTFVSAVYMGREYHKPKKY